MLSLTNNLTKFFTRNMAAFYYLGDDNSAQVYSQRFDRESGFNEPALYYVAPYSKVSKG
jgi:hypothetical protein